MYTCNVKLSRALGRFGCTVFITFGTLSILAQAKSGTVEFLSHPAHPYGRVHVGSPALGVSFKGDLLSGPVFIPGRFPGWVDTSLWIRLGGRVSIDGYLSFIQEWMCGYEHCSHFVSFQRNNVRATCRDHNCRECQRKRGERVRRAKSGKYSEQ